MSGAQRELLSSFPFAASRGFHPNVVLSNLTARLFCFKKHEREANAHSEASETGFRCGTTGDELQFVIHKVHPL